MKSVAFFWLLTSWFAVAAAEVQARPWAGNFLVISTPVDSLSEEEKVNHLLTYLTGLSGAVFIRNGKEYTPQKAADHLRSKWNKHKKKVKTARGFVQKLATTSKTDEPYQVRFPDGREVKCGELLQAELDKIER